MKRSIICLSLLVAFLGDLPAEGPAADPLLGKLFPSEFLMQHRAELGLTDRQIDQVHELTAEAAPQAERQHVRLTAAKKKLAELLDAEKVDEDAALKQLDNVLALEKEATRLRLRLMIQLRNELNAEQRRLAANLQQTRQRSDQLQQRMQVKIARIKREVQSRVQAGQSSLGVPELMRKFPALMQKGRAKEAEAVLDRALTVLELDDADSATDKRKTAAAPSPRPQPAIERGEPLSPKAVRSQVDGLHRQEVAWRKIAWKTCLLDGLKASRTQNKPIMLWIFIDRPIDDERC